jgi:amidase
MADAELLYRPATELAGMVRGGEVSARELTELALARLDEVDPKVNAFMYVDADAALVAADAIKPGDERPFAGVPTAIKDIGVFAAGMPFNCGSDLFGDFTPDFDSTVVSRIRNAGFVIVGKTKTPEMGILPVTEPRRYGPARNPYDLDRTPGGSSGGAAAAVAAGIVPIAHGSDGGGSLRIPGACCGLIGLKPARGRISYAPVLGDSLLTTEGMLTRTVADTAAMLDMLAGYEPGDANWAPPPATSFADAARREPGKLRIGFTFDRPVDVPVDPLHEQAVRDLAALLESLGHEVEEVSVPWRNDAAMLAFTQLWAVLISTLVGFGAQVGGQEPSEDNVELLTLEFWNMAQEIRALDLVSVDTTLKVLARAVVSMMFGYDMVLSPTLAQRPVPIGHIDSSRGMDAFGKAVEFTPFTAIANLTGQPAVSIPTGVAQDGLPLAVQIWGHPAGEEALLSLMAQIEQAQPWSDLRPSL